MLSIDLFDSKFEKKLHEGAVDDAEYARLKKLGEKIDYLKQARAKTTDLEMKRAIDGRIKEYHDERMEILSVRGMKEAEQSQQPPAKGLLKGKDLITPQQRVAGATPSKPGLAGAVKDVVGGIKRFVKGEPDQGPTFEQQDSPNPRALGVANFQRLVKANMGNVPTVNFEFIRPEENFKLDQRGLDLISDYYDGLANDQAKNYFIYRVLPSGDETLKVLKGLGWSLSKGAQQELPGIPSQTPVQGELPLSEKKKSKNQDDIKAGDIKVARELQKLRAQYPAARSDVEAVARAEIDSSERSRQQIAAIRGANEKQDTLLKQLVALDREQGKEIDSLDQENNSLEKQLAQVQSTNARLQQAIGQMTGTKVSARGKAIDLIPGAPADTKIPVPTTPQAEPEVEPTPRAGKSPAMAAMAQQIQGLAKPAPTIRPAPSLKAANEPVQLKAAESDLSEHGGGIGPRQHWQDLMPEQIDTQDDDWYDDEDDQETELRSGDYVRDTMDGEHGEVFRMQGDPYERRVRILDRDGRGWYIEPARLTRVDPQDPDVQRYFGKKRQRDMDEDINEGLLYSGDTWQDVLYRINVLNDIFGDQKDLAATFEPASQPEWGPFRDQILRSRTVLDTYAKVKQLANMNVPLTDVEIEMLADVAWDGGGGPVEPAGHWGERDYDWLEDLYAQQFAVVQHLLDQRAQGHGQNKTKSGQTVHEQGVAEAVDEKGALKSAQAAAKFIIRNLDDRAALKYYSQDFWSPEKFYQGATMAMRGAGVDEIVRHIVQDRPAQFEEGWSDAIVSQRTGSPRTPYSVYIKGKKWKDFENEDHAQSVATKLRAKFKADGRDPNTITIAPADMSEEALVEGIRDTAGATAVIACLLTGGSLSGCATAPQQTSAQQVLKTGQDLGRTVQTAQRITRAGVEAEVNQEIRNLLRGMSGRPEELNNSNILRIWRKIKGQPPVQPEPQAPEYGPAEPVKRTPQYEAREMHTREDFVKERDRLLRMISQETNPANKQILRSAIRQLENRAENEGWIAMQQRMIRESNASGDAEQAILKRIMVAHTDLLKQYGPQKVMQAAEEVAYNVGDLDEIGTSDVSGWVKQVQQILGATA
jgi:hypothetical protein